MGTINDESGTEPPPRGATKETRRALGRIPRDGTPALTQSPRAKTGRGRHPSAVGLRSAPTRVPGTNDKVIEKSSRVREQVAEAQQSRRQRVWDKLDAARSAAQNKKARLRRFSPQGKDPSGAL